MHAQVLAWFAAQVADLRHPITGLLDERLAVVEVGSLDINGSVRPLLRGVGHHHGLDLVAGPGVDEVADASTWVPPRAYDLAVSAEVLEHATLAGHPHHALGRARTRRPSARDLCRDEPTAALRGRRPGAATG